MSIIALHQVTKQFRNVYAVRDVDLDVAEGEFLTLLGPSGCGKTTLLRMIAGFEHPTSGHIQIAGRDVTDVLPNKREVNMVFQDYALFPHMSVFGNVAFGLSVAGVDKAEIRRRVDEALALVELSHRGDAMPQQLSGGQRQRVALARALVKRPKVLLLDEPLSALDASLRQQMQVELKRLQQKLGITFILVTHDQQEAMVMSDRIVVMRQGKVEQVGSPETLYDQPQTAFVASFFGSSTLLNGVVNEVDGSSAPSARETLEVQVGDLRLNCHLPSDVPAAPGTVLTLSIRPERVHCLLPGQSVQPGWNALDGVVSAAFFHGSMLRLQLDLGQVSLSCDLGRQQADALALTAGKKIPLAIAPEDIVVLAVGLPGEK